MSTSPIVFPSFISQMVEQSYYKFLSSGLKKKVLRPWMKSREIHLLKKILFTLKPKQCLEWGAGFSTLYYPAFIPSDSTWISIEHEKEWFDKIKDMNARNNVNIHFVAPNHFPWTDPVGDGSYSDLADYINFPDKFGRFDFILVDGRARVECVKKAAGLLSENGIVILHDANRTAYESPWNIFRYQVLLRDYRDIVGGFWIGSQSVDIHTLINVEEQIAIWDLYKKLGKTNLGYSLRL